MPAFRLLEITIPLLNEAQSLNRQVGRVLDFIGMTPALTGRTRLCLADNGSTDATVDVARRLEKECPIIRVVTVDQPGVGMALRASWQSSEAHYIGYMDLDLDLDLATDLNHLPESIARLEEGRADVVTGSRLLPASVVTGRSIQRAVVSRKFNRLMRTYVGTNVGDTTCGFKFLRRDLLEPIVSIGARSDGCFFCPELLVIAEVMGLKVAEIPATWTDDPESKVNIRKLSLEYLAAMRFLKKALRELILGQCVIRVTVP